MRDLTQDDERAVERLSFYMLKEAYGAIASVLAKRDPDTAATLFDRIETQIAGTLHRIDSQQSEGAASTEIATAIAETLAPILDECHGRDGGLGPKLPTRPSAPTNAP
ncbi:hypothetical protein [Methylobacterium haplocladii]|uniref:Uncharacterized protein n=1 Tax=Methylobacterium haplocladii TaxID=1176176 RepID=A0A512IUQ2_9HYPH|nr:hypothetical protein [Methylobacterium haplocladii]GEP01421.1 hypothetical protein MHA02_38080 [Methylobacterium haplocladii]GJD84965.1 hypothetical protein HPGCJGGD_2848 [Methylobacterium haplocladii]GLS59636.1 hypothetical protein GCM10007887_23050 [Methylobacterium haplocladii]